MIVTYWGVPEIQWTALEAMSTFGAVVLSIIFFLGPKAREYFYRPNIQASNAKILLVDDHDVFHIKYRIDNKPRFCIGGGTAVNLKTRLFFSKEQKEEEFWAYSIDVPEIIILQKNDKWLMNVKATGSHFPDSKYFLKLVFYQAGALDGEREVIVGNAVFTFNRSDFEIEDLDYSGENGHEAQYSNSFDPRS